LVVVNQTLARRYYPNGDIAGHVIKIPAFQARPPDWLTAPGADDWMQVIGVVGDSLNDGLDHPVRPAIFAPYSTLVPTGTQILIRTRVVPESVVYSIRKQLATVSPDQQTYGLIADLEKWIRDEPEWARGRLISALFAGFSIVALFLSGLDCTASSLTRLRNGPTNSESAWLWGQHAGMFSRRRQLPQG
jgi:putative ABC transport system permease protein